MLPRRPVRRLLLAVLACLPATALSAQEIAFPGIAWDAPADTVRARLEARGFAFSRAQGTGDQLYVAADSAWVRVTLRDGRAVGFTLADPARGAGVDARHRALADSLRARLGEPYDTFRLPGAGEPRMRLWAAGFASLRLSVEETGGPRRVETAWRGPGWHDEMSRRQGDRPIPAGFTIISQTSFMRIAVDTTRGGAAGQRTRFRIDYGQPVTPSANGVPQDPIDAAEYDMEIDCAGRKTRLFARTTYLDGAVVERFRSAGQPQWTVPQPDGHHARGRDAVCRTRRGRA